VPHFFKWFLLYSTEIKAAVSWDNFVAGKPPFAVATA
jgi:hypothetical protein